MGANAVVGVAVDYEVLGEKNGMQKILHDLVRKKLIKNKSLEQIAEEIEESVDTVSPMYV